MKKIALFSGIFLLYAILFACAPKSVSTEKPASPQLITKEVRAAEREPWQVEWGKTVEEAKKEGRLSIMTTFGTAVREAFREGFNKAAGITAEIMTGRGAELSQKILTERRAGLYLYDVYIGGPTTIYTVLKPAGVIDSLKPALILPEILDPKAWYGGRLPFADMEEKYVIAFRASPTSGAIIVNTEQVKEGEIGSYLDLLDPKWKGKIIINDPSSPGRGARWFMTTVMWDMNEDYMRKLAEQKPLITRDQRQQVEWVARGRYPIAIGILPDQAEEFMKAGAPLAEVALKEETRILSAGHGSLALINNAPHPNAAKSFINWLLSREGQTLYTRADEKTSARIDVPIGHLPQSERVDPKVKYKSTDSEEFRLNEPKYQKMAAEIFAPLMK